MLSLSCLLGCMKALRVLAAALASIPTMVPTACSARSTHIGALAMARVPFAVIRGVMRLLLGLARWSPGVQGQVLLC